MSVQPLLAPLFSPARIGRLEIANRFVMAPMTRSRSPDGVPGPDVAAYYRRRAEGEVGLILTEGVGVPHPAAIGFSGVDVMQIPSMYGDAALAGWRRVVDEVHQAGGLIAPQLWHQGPMRTPGTGAWPDAESMRPSGLWGPLGRVTTVPQDYVDQVSPETRPMTDEEIADVIAAYVQAAVNAKALGFDAIAIHGGHGYLIDAFWWAETNRRNDRWGGDVARRSAFAAELVRAIRAGIGTDLPIILRFSQWKQQDFHGRLAETPDELGGLLQPAAEAGVDAFDVSARNFDAPAFDGSPLSLAGWARRLTARPAIAIGSIGLAKGMYESHRDGGAEVLDNLGRLAERFDNGEFDFAGVGRMLIAHPDWVKRVRLGLPLKSYDRSMLATLA